MRSVRTSAGRGPAASCASGASVDVLIALLWGAFVGLVKASRLGYLQLDDTKLEYDDEPRYFYTDPIAPHNQTFSIKDEELDEVFNW